MTETEFQQRILDTAHLYGWMTHHTRPAQTTRGWRTPITGHQGFPDLVLARAGRLIVAELKTDRGKLGPGQPEWLHTLGTHGRLWRPRDWNTVLTELKNTP